MQASHRTTLLALIVCGTTLFWGCSGPASVKDRDGLVRGTVVYLQPILLPPDADLVIQLRQLSGPGEPPRLVAERVIESPGRLPVSFELRYDRRATDATRRLKLPIYECRRGTAVFPSSISSALGSVMG